MHVATINLPSSWLFDPTNPSVYVAAGSSGGAGGPSAPVRSAVRDGEVREYAGNRFRLISGPATARGIGLTLRGCTPAQVLQLEAWRGTLLLFRDTYGVRQYGCYLSTDITQWRNNVKADVTVDWRELTYQEAV